MPVLMYRGGAPGAAQMYVLLVYKVLLKFSFI